MNNNYKNVINMIIKILMILINYITISLIKLFVKYKISIRKLEMKLIIYKLKIRVMRMFYKKMI